MRVLVTGAAGFLGRRVAHCLRGKGHEVIAIVRSGDSPAAAALKADGAELLACDLRAAALSHGLPAGVDAVVSLAQSRHFRDFPAGAEDVFDVNVAANLRLLHWATQHSVPRFLLVSSGGVRAIELSDTRSRLSAGSPALDFYLATKLSAELALCAFRDRLRAAIVIRPFFVYGPGQRADMLIPRLIESVRGGRPVRLQGPDGFRTTPVYVQDMAAAVCAAVGSDEHGVYDVGGLDMLSLREIAIRIGRVTGHDPVFEQIDGPPVDYIANRSEFCERFPISWTAFDAGIALTVSPKAANVL